MRGEVMEGERVEGPTRTEAGWLAELSAVLRRRRP